jgi:hypothetical protein
MKTTEIYNICDTQCTVLIKPAKKYKVVNISEIYYDESTINLGFPEEEFIDITVTSNLNTSKDIKHFEIYKTGIKRYKHKRIYKNKEPLLWDFLHLKNNNNPKFIKFEELSIKFKPAIKLLEVDVHNNPILLTSQTLLKCKDQTTLSVLNSFFWSIYHMKNKIRDQNGNYNYPL